jgi:hypothetical protein
MHSPEAYLADRSFEDTVLFLRDAVLRVVEPAVPLRAGWCSLRQIERVLVRLMRTSRVTVLG